MTRGGASLPDGKTSDRAPVLVFRIMYSLFMPRHMFSPHQDMDFTTSGMLNSFTSTNSRPPSKKPGNKKAIFFFYRNRQTKIRQACSSMVCTEAKVIE